MWIFSPLEKYKILLFVVPENSFLPGGAAAQRLGLAQPHLALEYTAGLGVELVHLQLELVLEITVPLDGGDVPDGLVRDGVDGAHGNQVLVAGSQHEPLQAQLIIRRLRGTLLCNQAIS